ncbi:MAG: ABC transporter ATP-binding protein [Phyllobacterium sp.]
MSRLRLDFRGQAFRKVLSYTFRHWQKQPVRIAVICAAVLLSTMADVLLPLYSGRLVDAVASGAATNETAWNAALAAFWMLILLGAAAVAMRQMALAGIIQLTLRIMPDMVHGAFHRVQRLSTDWHANTFAGSTVRKITRGMWAMDVLNDTLLLALLPSVVMLAGSSLLLGWHWPLMGAIIALGSAIYIVVTAMLSLGYVAPAASLSNQWDTRMGGALADAVTCNSVVKSFGAETREEERLARLLAKWRNRTRRTWYRSLINGTTQGVMLHLLRSSITAAALFLWWRGEASAGDIAFVLTSFFMLQGYLRDVGHDLHNLQRSVNDMEELVALHGQPFGVADLPSAKPAKITDGRIVFDHVDFVYGNHSHALYNDLNVTIEAGERVGLVGYSGSGKTTFVKMIQRLIDATGGRVLIDGQDVREVTQASLRAQIAIVSQEPILFHRSLSENIAYGRPGATMEEIIRAAELASAHDFITRLPKGYETMVGERGIKLSGGERQRVALARAFLADAPILILDEATSSLDSESEALIQEAMERLMIGRTTLIIAHRLSTVRSLDRLLVFDRGKVVEEGDHEALIRHGGIYRRLFDRQALELSKGLLLDS